MAVDHLLQENGDRFNLEDGTGHLILESSTSFEDDDTSGVSGSGRDRRRTTNFVVRLLRRRRGRR